MSNLVAQFFGNGNDLLLEALAQPLRDVIDPWLVRAEKGSETAFLPRAWQGRLWWYGFTADATSRREVLSLLDAWIGPTASDLPSVRGRLDLSDRFDAAIADERPGRVLRFEVLPRKGPGVSDARLQVRGSLRRLSQLLECRPPSELQVARSIGEVFEDLGHAISTGDRSLASQLLEELRASGEVEETNLAFLRVRVNAGFGLWHEVLTDQALPDLLQIRRPPGLTRALQQAVYEVHLASLDKTENDASLLQVFEDLREQYEGLERGNPPALSRRELIVQFLFGLSSDPAIRAAHLARLLGDADAIELGLKARLRRLQSHAETAPVPAIPADPLALATSRYLMGDALGALDDAVTLVPSLAVARLAVMAAADVGTVEAATTALNFLQTQPGLQGAIADSGSIGRAAIKDLERLTDEGAPDSWAAWFSRLDTGVGRDEALSWVRERAEEWQPLPAEALDRISNSPDSVLAILGEVAGLFLLAHAHALDGSSRANVAESLIAALAMSGRTSAGVQVQALSLIDAFLSAGPTADQVASGLGWLGELRKSMAASGTIDWQVDLLQTVAFHPIPDQAHDARQLYLYESIEDLRRFRTALDATALESVAGACESFGLALPDDLESLRDTTARAEKDLYRCLAGQKIVLYSLMESSSRRAAETLRRLVPSVDVVPTADRAGNDRLADLSRNADIFVIVTASAKHAASEFIELERKGRRIYYIHSKGSSAILRGLAEICS